MANQNEAWIQAIDNYLDWCADNNKPTSGNPIAPPTPSQRHSQAPQTSLGGDRDPMPGLRYKLLPVLCTIFPKNVH